MIHTAYSFQELPEKVKCSIESLAIDKNIKEDWLVASEKLLENNRVFYYVEMQDETIKNFIVGNIIQNLDCSIFISDEKILQQIAKKREDNLNFYKYDVLFIGSPMGIGTGVYSKNKQYFRNSFNKFKQYVFEFQNIDGIFFTSDSMENKKISFENSISFSYYPNTILELPYDSFEAYLKARKKKKRWDIKNKKKKFEKLGCSIEVIPNASVTEKDYTTMFELYRNTEKKM